MYVDTTEILEALGVDPAFGLCEWVGDRHVDDILAIAEVLYMRQRGIEVSWIAPGEEADFLFTEDLNQSAEELGIRARSDEEASRVPAACVSPSFKSYGVNGEYVAQKVYNFFMMHCAPRHPEHVTFVQGLNRNHDEWHVDVKHIERGYTLHNLARLPVHYRYARRADLRLELGRLLQEAIRLYGVSDYFFADGMSVRHLHHEGMHFVEALWGLVARR